MADPRRPSQSSNVNIKLGPGERQWVEKVFATYLSPSTTDEDKGRITEVLFEKPREYMVYFRELIDKSKSKSNIDDEAMSESDDEDEAGPSEKNTAAQDDRITKPFVWGKLKPEANKAAEEKLRTEPIFQFRVLEVLKEMRANEIHTSPACGAILEMYCLHTMDERLRGTVDTLIGRDSRVKSKYEHAANVCNLRLLELYNANDIKDNSQQRRYIQLRNSLPAQANLFAFLQQSLDPFLKSWREQKTKGREDVKAQLRNRIQRYLDLFRALLTLLQDTHTSMMTSYMSQEGAAANVQVIRGNIELQHKIRAVLLKDYGLRVQTEDSDEQKSNQLREVERLPPSDVSREQLLRYLRESGQSSSRAYSETSYPPRNDSLPQTLQRPAQSRHLTYPSGGAGSDVEMDDAILSPSSSSETPRCNICGKTFGRPYDLQRHMDTLHSNEGPEYRCPICSDTSFRRKDHLTAHLRNNHGLEPSSRGKAKQGGRK